MGVAGGSAGEVHLAVPRDLGEMEAAKPIKPVPQKVVHFNCSVRSKRLLMKNTNSLIVSASQQNLAVIRELVKELDTKRFSEPETRVFSLKYGDATEIANELNQAFSSSAQNVFAGGGFGGFWWLRR